jgi:alpha/beta superfamily hydrolase
MSLTLPNENTFLLPGPIGDIEICAAASDSNKNTTVILCHPHSLFGGTMHNKVVTTMARAFGDLNLRTVRFNFRGVGKTAGTFDKGIGETDDVLAIAKWLQTTYPNDALWLAGFSFGSYVAARAATQLPTQQLISVAPAVINFPFHQLPAITCPWLIIQGEQDEIVPPEAVFSWIATLQPQPTVMRFPDTGHFFHGKLMELRKILVEQLGL